MPDTRAIPPATASAALESPAPREARPVGLLDSISAFCRVHAMAESTFGRRAVNDGKFVSRLRDGARITPETLARVAAYMAKNGAEAPLAPPELLALVRPKSDLASPPTSADGAPQRNFRFFDNRQKYLLFVNTCSEKEVIARRVGLELAHLHPEPPAVRLFDAGMGDGTVLTRVLREMHRRMPNLPFYVVGKEISLEDVRLSLDKIADRLFEHPATVLVVTNMYYTEAPWLAPRALPAATSMIWHEVALTGTTSNEFSEQIADLEPFLAKFWQARHSPKTGNPMYERPVALVIYRDDFRFLLDDIVPRQGHARADFDLVMASQPYRLRVPVAFKASRVIAPLVRALRPGGRLIGIHSAGGDPGLEIVQKVWPGENPYQTDRHAVLRAVKTELGKDARHYNLNAYADNRAIFRYAMHTLPTEISSSIGTSTLFAAWNAAVYVAQIDDERLAAAVGDRKYLDATREVLQSHGSLWFQDESYVISRKRD
jgi:SAM-dependent methyltransferase